MAITLKSQNGGYLVLGLNASDLDGLLDGRPLHIRYDADQGMPFEEIVIGYGRTNEDVLEALRDEGIYDAD